MKNSSGGKTTTLSEWIDKLTNSIENVVTGESFTTQVLPATAAEARKLKKPNWVFDWGKELRRWTGKYSSWSPLRIPVLFTAW